MDEYTKIALAAAGFAWDGSRELFVQCFDEKPFAALADYTEDLDLDLDLYYAFKPDLSKPVTLLSFEGENIAGGVRYATLAEALIAAFR